MIMAVLVSVDTVSNQHNLTGSNNAYGRKQALGAGQTEAISLSLPASTGRPYSLAHVYIPPFSQQVGHISFHHVSLACLPLLLVRPCNNTGLTEKTQGTCRTSGPVEQPASCLRLLPSCNLNSPWPNSSFTDTQDQDLGFLREILFIIEYILLVKHSSKYIK